MGDFDMENFVSELELSVRTGNILRDAGVRSYEDFMALTEKDVRALPRAGTKVWGEISFFQHQFSPDAEAKRALASLKHHLAGLNAALSRLGVNYRVEKDPRGGVRLFTELAPESWEADQ